MGMSASGQIRPWRSIGVDGSLSLNSYRPGRMLVTEESDYEPPSYPRLQCSSSQEVG